MRRLPFNMSVKKTKIKLELLDQEGITWLIMDIQKELEDTTWKTEKLVEQLRIKYLEYIKENAKRHGKQGSLFQD